MAVRDAFSAASSVCHDAVVMPAGALSVDLLGMSFLSRLAGIKVSGRQMVLSP